MAKHDKRRGFFRKLLESMTPGVETIEKANKQLEKRIDSAIGDKKSEASQGGDSSNRDAMINDMIKKRRATRASGKKKCM